MRQAPSSPRASTARNGHRATERSHPVATRARGVAPAVRHTTYTARGRHGRQHLPLVAVAVALVLIVGAGAGIGYQFFWRSVDISVNGQESSGRIGMSVHQFLEDNGYFGVKAGRLLSVGGNVLDEQGGERCSVIVDGEAIDSDGLDRMKLADGLALTVSDGADATEGHTEETVDAMPGIVQDGSGAIQFVSQWGKSGKKKVWIGEESGETIDKGVLEEATDMVVSYYNPKPKGDKKYIALTFDDGPSTYTEDILGILARYGAKATFFNLGTQVDGKSQEVVDGGHELASHTNQHANLPDCDRDSLRAEITSAADAIEGASGVRPQMIRAPYGAFTLNEWAHAGDLISCNVLWNIDTLDWKRPGAAAITDAVLSNAYNGAIVLMHDGGGNRSQDVEALPGIIEALQSDGYELVTVSELMELDGRFPEDVIKGTVKMPEDAVLPEV